MSRTIVNRFVPTLIDDLLLSQTFTETISGGIQANGSAVPAATYNLSVSGGIQASGSADESV